TVEFHELADDSLLAQDLRDGQHEISGGTPLMKSAVQFEAHHRRQQHGDRLAEHTGLRLDASDAPSEHTETVHHGRVRVCSHERIGIGFPPVFGLLAENYRSQVFQIDLVHDAGVGRNDAEILKSFLAPPQQKVAFLVALELQNRIHLKRIG